MKIKFVILIYFLSVVTVFSKSPKIVKVKVKKEYDIHVFAKKYLKVPKKWKLVYKYNKSVISDSNKIFSGTELKIPLELLKKNIADIKYLKGDVYVKKEENKVWEVAKLDSRLFPGDAIMTWEKSNAVLYFLVGGRMVLEENTLVFLKETKTDEVAASIVAGGLNVNAIKVLSENFMVKPDSNAVYKVEVDRKKTARISVYKFNIEITSKGKKVIVKEGFRTIVKYKKPPELPQPLPERYEIGRILKQDEYYHIQISEDPEFEKIVKDYNTRTLEDMDKGLSPGKYYWRASVIDKEGFESEYSPKRSFIIGPKSKESLVITSITRNGDLLEIKGYYPDITSLIVNGYPGKIYPKGKFEVDVPVKGVNILAFTIKSKNKFEVRKFKKNSKGMWLPIK